LKEGGEKWAGKVVGGRGRDARESAERGGGEWGGMWKVGKRLQKDGRRGEDGGGGGGREGGRRGVGGVGGVGKAKGPVSRK